MRLRLRREPVSCLVQLALEQHHLWTSSTRRLELGALQNSARLDVVLQPRRCRMPESRYLLEARFSLALFILVGVLEVLHDGYGCEGDA